MNDWERILNDLLDMASYFFNCAAHSATGSKSHKRFWQYVQTLEVLIEQVREMLSEEDDGK